MAIYRLSPYEEILAPSMKGGDVDSSFLGHYIVYNLPQTDTGYLRKLLNPFINSVIRRYPNLASFELDFYNPGAGLDTNYSENKYNQLYNYNKNLLATISASYNVDTFSYNNNVLCDKRGRNNVISYYWNFYKDGEIMMQKGSDIQLKNYVPNRKNGDK